MAIRLESGLMPLKGFKHALDQLYATNYAAGGKITADAVRVPEFSPANVLKKGRETYWATPDETTTATLTLTLPEMRTFDAIRLAEPTEGILMGDGLQCGDDGGQEFGAGASFGTAETLFHLA